ncbi:MAG: hypothetical protein V1246_08365, partial [Arenicellales bacterium]|nr:hypothetical protein [Arenicellales bacterium]
MTDDFLITLQHEGYLLKVLMFWFAPLSKPVTLSFFKERCQIRSELLQFKKVFAAFSVEALVSRSFSTVPQIPFFSPSTYLY